MRPLAVLWLATSLAAAGCSGVDFPAGSSWAVRAVPSWAHQARYAITDNRSDELSFVTAGQAVPQLLGNVPVGDNPVELEGPHHLAASPDGKFIYYNLSNYVPGTGTGPHGSHGTGTVPGSLVKLDAGSAAEVAEVLIDRSPGDVILSTDGKTAYVSHYDLLKVQAQLAESAPAEAGWSTVAIVDTASMVRLAMIPVCATAHGEGLSADGKTLYVTCALSDSLAIVDVSDRSHPMLKMTVPVGPAPGTLTAPKYSPYALAVSPKDGSVWVSDNLSGDVRVFDPATQKMDPKRVFFVNGVTMFGAFTHDGSLYYVPHQGDDKVSVIDTTALTMTSLALPPNDCLNAHMLQISPDEKQAVVVCEGDHVTRPGSLVVLSIKPLAVTGSVETALFSDGAAWLPPAP